MYQGPGVTVVARVPTDGSGAAAHQRGGAAAQRLFGLLRRDEVYVGVDTAGGQDLALARDDVGAGSDDDGDAGLDVGIAGLADPADAAVLHADIGLHDAPVVEDDRIGDHQVGHLGGHGLALAHAVADDLAATEGHLVAIDGVVLLDLDDELRVGQPDAVAGGGAVEVCIGAACDLHHVSAPGFP